MRSLEQLLRLQLLNT